MYLFHSGDHFTAFKDTALLLVSDVKKEAVSALNVAQDLQSQGKTERAKKIFQHALALDPTHADILTAYGEFLELHMNDVTQADHYYKIALEMSPMHSKALANRQRTSPIVEDIDHKRFSRVDQKRSLFYSVPSDHPAMRRAKEEAYFAHIYHSNAIEGNTLSLVQTRAIVETKVAVGGKSLTEQSEVLGLDAALSYLNSTLVGRVRRLFHWLLVLFVGCLSSQQQASVPQGRICSDNFTWCMHATLDRSCRSNYLI